MSGGELDGDALGREIRELPRSEPPPGWETRVLQEIDRRARTSAPARQERRPWLAASLAVAAAVVLVVVLRPDKPAPEPRFALAVDTEPGPTRTRTESAAVGDMMRATATLGSPKAVWDVRVYRDDGLIACCNCRPQQPTARMRCVQKGTHVDVSWRLEQPGVLRAVLFGGDRQAPTTSSLVEDISAATGAGLQAVTDDPLEVF